MKILFLSVRSDIGGGPKHLKDIVENLSKCSDPIYDITIAAPLEEPFAPKFKELSKNFIEIPKRKFSINSFLEILDYCLMNKIDLVHSHGRGAGVYSRILYLFGFRVVHTFHGIHQASGFLGKLKVLTDKILRPFTDQFICVSDDEREEAIQLKFAPQNKIKVIKNGIDYQTISNQNFSKTLRDQNSEKVILGFLAREDYQKGLDLLLTSVKELPEEIQNQIVIYIAGPSQTGEFNSIVKDNQLDHIIKVIGPTNQPLELLANLDVYLSFARWEGLPLSVLEAMSLKKPCLLSNVKGHQDLNILDAPYFFDPSDPLSFKQGVLYYLLKDNRLFHGEASFRTIKKNFSIELMIDKLLNVYKEKN